MKAANINKPYMTIAQVLSDTATLNALMNSTAAVDYLVTVKGWINDICSNSNAMTAIGNSNYASNTLLADSDWSLGIVNSDYRESIFNVKVPAMTSATTPSGTVSASSTYSGRNAYNAFDGNDSNNVWGTSLNAITNQWIQYKFDTAVKIKAVRLLSSTGNSNVRRFYTGNIAVSNDNNPTTILKNYSQNNIIDLRDIFTNNENYYTTYRVNFVSAASGADMFEMYEVQFYGRQDV